MSLPYLFFIGYLACWILAMRNPLKSQVRNRGAWRFTAVLLTVGLASLLAARCIGSSIDKDGYLQEPFFLIGGGSLLSLAGSCLTLGLLLRGLFCRGEAPKDKSQAA
ncbi:MAG: DUF3955 domain-containing protein [Verrucomicrobia bacterium]|nr:DUF3955 domain-containing protein [Verrucomicrobiota bacterium]